MQPVLGSTVIYRMSEYDALTVNRRSRGDGFHGNEVREGDQYPAQVVRTFGSDTVNLKVNLDGDDVYWATSRPCGGDAGQWSDIWTALIGEEVSGPDGHTAPQVGDMVHYLSFGTPPKTDGSQAYTSQCRAAFVTEVTEVEVNESNPAGDGIYRPTVGLMVANPTGQFFARGVLFVEASEAIAHPETCGGTWHPADHGLGATANGEGA